MCIRDSFCNTLTGNINQEEAILSGNVVVAYDQILMNRGEEAILTLNKTKGIGRWNGPGQALFLETPIDVSQDKRIERPNASPSANGDATEISMRANWHQGLTIDQRFNDNAGAVTLNGEVDMRSRLRAARHFGISSRLHFAAAAGSNVQCGDWHKPMLQTPH
mgnify:CR=1 FL=1